MTATPWSPDLPLPENPSAEEVRARFDDLMENMPERYEQQIWDAQVVAYYIACEAEAAGVAKGRRESKRPAAEVAEHNAREVRKLQAGYGDS